eukprot:jgi/Botrbrau1/230/Bobra.0022s0209.1
MFSSFFTTQKDEKQIAREQQRALEELKMLLASTKSEEQLRLGGEPGLGGGAGLDNETLLRWLRAEKFAVSKAYTRIVKHAQWRADYVPDGRIHESEVKNELAAKKAFLMGHDKKGHAAAFIVVRNHLKSTRDLHETKRYICYCIDALTRATKSEDGKVSAILDLQDLTMDNLDASTLKAIFDLLQEHYPERLGMMFMFKPPTIFWALWAVVKPFLDPVTQAKVSFLKDSSGWSQFGDLLDLEGPASSTGREEGAGVLLKVQRADGVCPQGETITTPPKHVAVDDDGKLSTSTIECSWTGKWPEMEPLSR